METRVVNVKVGNIRPHYNNLKEWCQDSKNVYIGRKGVVFIEDNQGTKKRYPPCDSIFANPFKVGKNSTRDEAVKEYREYLRERIESGEITQEDLDSLRGKNLGCWCKPERCHGDIILEFLEEKKRLCISPEGYLLDEDGYVVVEFM